MYNVTRPETDYATTNTTKPVSNENKENFNLYFLQK